MVSFFLLLLLGPLQLETLHFDVNVRAVKHSEICQLIFLSTLLSMFGGLTGCVCFGIIIIMSGIWAETGALSVRSRLKPFPAFVLFLFKKERELKDRRCWNRRIPQGLLIAEISSMCALHRSLKEFSISSTFCESIAKGQVKGLLLLKSTQLCQGLVKINGTRVSSDSCQAVCALSWAPNISQTYCADNYCSCTFDQFSDIQPRYVFMFIYI